MLPVPADSVLIAVLREAGGPLDLSSEGPLRALLPEDDRDFLIAGDIDAAAALGHGDGMLDAIVVLGAKRSARALTRRDLWYVTALTTAAATAWDPGDSKTVHGGLAERAPAPSHEGQAAFECPRCGSVTDPLPLPCECTDEPVLASLPRHLGGKFIVERRIGAGGMGVVYLARDTALDRDVALKTLPSLRERTVARLRDEARVMAGLNHESLATLYGLELWRRTPVLVVEYFPEGPSSAGWRPPGRSRHRRSWHQPRPRAGVHARQRRAAPRHQAEQHRVLRCGPAEAARLRPCRVQRTADRRGDSTRRQSGRSIVVRGTPAYMPPEAFDGAPASPAFDLWALAVVLAGNRRRTRPVRSHDGARDVSRPFFARALAQNPAERFQTAVELRAALEDPQNADVHPHLPVLTDVDDCAVEVRGADLVE